MNPQLEMHLQEFERAAADDHDDDDDDSEEQQQTEDDDPQLPHQLVAKLEHQAGAMDALVERAQHLGDTSTSKTRPFQRMPPKAFVPRMLYAARHYGWQIFAVLFATLYVPAKIAAMTLLGGTRVDYEMPYTLYESFAMTILLVCGTFLALQLWMSSSWVKNSSIKMVGTQIKMLQDDEDLNDTFETDHPLHACRLEMSRLLGSIGAPFLSEDHAAGKGQLQKIGQSQQSALIHTTTRNMEETTASSNTPTFSPSLLFKVARANVQLIQTYDDAMETMKMGTALHLGATTKSAERVERALFGRRRREQQKKGALQQNVSDESPTVDIYPVSFGTLRGSVSRAMIAQAQTLESIIAVLNDSCQGERDNDNDSMSPFLSFHPLAGGVPPVVTLTWLRSSRQQLSECLSYVLEALATFDRPITDRENTQDILVNSVLTVEELQQYLQSSLGIENEGTQRVQQEQSSEKGNRTASKQIQERVIQTQLQLQQLYVALGAMNDTSKISYSSNKVDTIEWWDRVNQLSQKVQNTMQMLDQEHFQPIDGDVGGDDEDTEEPSSSKQVTREQSYTMEANAEKAQQKPTPQILTKTSVFSGKGAKKPPKPRPRNVSEQGPFFSDSTQMSTTALPQSDPVAQHFLLSELRTRLQTLSLPEEEHEVEDFEDDYEMVKSAPAPAAKAFVEKTTAMPSFGGLLVGELSNAVKLLGNQNKSDDEETFLE